MILVSFRWVSGWFSGGFWGGFRLVLGGFRWLLDGFLSVAILWLGWFWGFG